MINIDSLQTGTVIDHISAGKGMKVYNLLGLDKLDCCVAVIKNARSKKYGRKDIIKIEGVTDINLNVLGFIDHNSTVDIIKNGKIVEKKKPQLPKTLVNVVQCKNPRCITTEDSNLEQIFVLSGQTEHCYRCLYCEQEYSEMQL